MWSVAAKLARQTLSILSDLRVERKLIMDEKAYAAALAAWEAVRAEPLVAHRPKYWLEHHHVTCA